MLKVTVASEKPITDEIKCLIEVKGEDTNAAEYIALLEVVYTGLRSVLDRDSVLHLMRKQLESVYSADNQ